MKIGLLGIDSNYPNLALMKISGRLHFDWVVVRPKEVYRECRGGEYGTGVMRGDM